MHTDDLKQLLESCTPGPWITSSTDDTVVIAMDRSEVAAIDGDYNQPETWPIMEANARLIALAPQLAAEVIKLREEVGRLRGNQNSGSYLEKLIKVHNVYEHNS